MFAHTDWILISNCCRLTFLSAVLPTPHLAHEDADVFNITDAKKLRDTEKESGTFERQKNIIK